ncbi:MAG TPA: VCBS repeat-containing protein [Bryobacteraceae bacterium]|nr:VCBS repeat-containing protein [Bryobacteraceae bacterium]
MTRLFLSALLAGSLAAQTLSFTPFNVTAGSAPMAVRLIDFNGDSRPDIVVINAGGLGTVSVLLNQGGGKFSKPITTETGGLGAVTLTSGDFNHDGKADLAVVNNLSNDVSILLGLGNGTFQPGTFVAVHGGPVAITEADFNHDGNLDLAVVNSFTGDLSILLGKRDGGFQPASNVYVGSAPTNVKAGDFNGDGIPDLAVTNGTQGLQLVKILLGNGDGTFRDAGNLAVGNEPFALVAHDFNQDGKTDLAVANLASNNLSVLLGNGDGTFLPAVNYDAGNGPVGIRAGHFGGHGILDLVACADVSQAVLVFPGKGDGTFGKPLSFPIGDYCNSVAVGDLVQAGRTDIVTAMPSGVVLLLNNGH